MPHPARMSFQTYLDRIRDLLCDVRCARAGTAIAHAASDSRQVRPGGVFVAIPGSRVDGTEFIPQAIAAGAAAVVVPAGTVVDNAEVAVAWVSDPYAAAGRIAEAFYGDPAGSLRVVAVTGTNGKTTCSLLLHAMLTATGQAAGLISTVSYDCGQGAEPAERTTPTPFDLQALLARMRANQVRDAVMEVSSHAMAQGRIGSMGFHGAVFTNLTADHLDYHRSMECYYQAKKRLFTRHCVPRAPAVINVEDEYGCRLAEEIAADN